VFITDPYQPLGKAKSKEYYGWTVLFDHKIRESIRKYAKENGAWTYPWIYILDYEERVSYYRKRRNGSPAKYLVAKSWLTEDQYAALRKICRELQVQVNYRAFLKELEKHGLKELYLAIVEKRDQLEEKPWILYSLKPVLKTLEKYDLIAVFLGSQRIEVHIGSMRKDKDQLYSYGEKVFIVDSEAGMYTLEETPFLMARLFLKAAVFSISFLVKHSKTDGMIKVEFEKPKQPSRKKIIEHNVKNLKKVWKTLSKRKKHYTFI